MSQTFKSLGIDQLSVAQRVLLVEEIWDSIAADAEELPMTRAQEQDLQRRLAAYHRDPQAGTSWEEVKARCRVPKHYTVSDGELVLFLWPAEEGGYDVTSPLDPALITQAETLEEAFVMARDAWELLKEARSEV
jgi:putative addiction module component (TIGR02574 family)